MGVRAAAACTLAIALATASPAGAAAPRGEWLAGDLHVHTCYSEDVFCPPFDEGEPEELYTYGLPVAGRFAEAAARGLDYLAITDHNDVSSVSDPGFGSSGVIGVPGYENSIRGHAQMLGARRIYDSGDESAAAIVRMMREMRSEGGVFQINHPAYRVESEFRSCADQSMLHWPFGFAVQPNTIELWNPTSPIAEAERYLECWLERGARIAPTGGSDAHWLTTAPAGAGNPTTWVFAREHTTASVLEALRRGRTSVTRRPPANGGAPLLLEGDSNRNGRFDAIVGGQVRPRTAMRVRSLDPSASGFVRVRANGATLLDAPLPPSGELRFLAPARPGWVRAVLRSGADDLQGAPGCEPGDKPISTCPYDFQVQAITAPLYVTPSR